MQFAENVSSACSSMQFNLGIFCSLTNSTVSTDSVSGQ